MRHRVLLAVLALWLATLPALALAAGPHRTVLILYSYSELVPWQARIHAALQARLEEIDPASRPEVYEERLDSSRIDRTISGPALVTYLRAKFAALHFDTVIAESSAATHVLLANPDLFAGARRYAIDPGVDVPEKVDGIEVIRTQGDWAEASLRTLTGVLPELKRLIVVTDLCPVGQANKRKLLAAAGVLPAGVALEVWDDYTVADLLARSARLPPGSALFYTPVFMDRTGARQVPAAVLQSLAQTAAAPIFAYHDLYLGKGIVGGRLLSSQRFGAMMADLALGPGYAERWDHAEAVLNPVMFDAAELRRWGIPERRLPPDAIVVGRVTSAWWRFRYEIGLAAAALSLESALILCLVRALYQRDRAVKDVMRERDGLELRVAERTRDLEVSKRRLESSNAHLQTLADSDALTTVANRRKILATLESEWGRAERDGSDLCVLMLDIDRFKSINDGHGHEAGDHVIRAFAEICRSALPATGCIGRLGGEEFAVILPGASLADATLCAERIRKAVRTAPVAAAPGVALSVTVSIGVGRRDGPEDSPSALMARADAALYDAKRNGRDRVVSRAEAGPVEPVPALVDG